MKHCVKQTIHHAKEKLHEERAQFDQVCLKCDLIYRSV